MRHKLKKVRSDLGLTQEEVATRAGIDRTTYTNIERGHKNPSLKVAIRIKQALNYREDDIFFEPGVPKRHGSKEAV